LTWGFGLDGGPPPGVGTARAWGYGSGGSGANPGRVPRVPAAQAVYDLEGGTWFAAV